MALLVEVDPLGLVLVLGLHIADDSAVALAPAAVDADDILAQNAIAIAELDAGLLGVGLGIGSRTIRGVGVQTCLVTLVDPRAVGTVGGNGHHIVELLLATPSDVGRPQGTTGLQTTIVADTGAVILGIDGNVERQVLGLPQVSLTQRVIIASIDHILNVGHFPHEVQVVVIIGTIQCIQINRNLIHGIRTVHARIVVGGALRDQHGTVPIGNARALAGREVNGLLDAVAHLVGAVLRGKVLRRNLHLLHSHGSAQRLTLLDLLAILGRGAGHLDGSGLANGKSVTNGNDLSVSEGAALALGGGVLQIVGILRAQRDLDIVGGEFLGSRFHGHVRIGFALHVEDADRAALGGTGNDLMVGDHNLTTIDLIRVGAIVKRGVHTGKALVAAHVGNDHTIVLDAVSRGALNHQAGLVAAVLQVLALAIHGVTEVVDCRNGLVLPHIVTGVAQLGLLGELRVGAARALRTVEVQRSAGPTGTNDRPAHHDLIVGETGGFLVAVGVVIMGLNPSDQLVFACAAGIDVLHHLDIKVVRADSGANGLAVVGSGVAAAIGGIVAEHVSVCLVVKAGIALQHLAVLELGAILQNGVPVVRLLIIEDFGRQLDVLGGIVTEAVNTVRHSGLQELLHTIGNSLVLRIQIPQAKQVALRHLVTVGIIVDLAVGAVAAGTLVEVVLVLPVGVDGVPIGGEVVGDHIHDHAHAVLVGGGGHFLQISLSADHEVTDGGVRRLVHVVPVLGELLAVGGDFLDLAHRLGLHGGVAGRGDLRHVLRNGLERPHPCVQDGAVLHVLGQTVLVTGSLERRISDGVLVAVTIGGKCGGCHTHTAEQRGDRHCSSRSFLPSLGGT